MLLDVLREKRCFKLICGAENEDEQEVERLVTIYSLAGCTMFDLSANVKIVDAAKRGLERSGIKNDRYLCVSVGTKGDSHISKAVINPKNCIKCGLCKRVCPQNTIIENENSYEVNLSHCIGCNKCHNICPQNTIEMKYEIKDFKKILPPLIDAGIDCIEFHISTDDDDEIFTKWEYIKEIFSGNLSICINRSKCSDEVIINRLKKMIEGMPPYSITVQADGIPMSGGIDNYNSTLQAIAMADIIEKSNLPVNILISGGTNSKSTELAKLCQVNIDGISMGSYARKLIKDYIKREDFFENKEIFNEALNLAKNLVNISLSNLL